ncbi:helix-turn-helix domain-containing protein [Nonomuraea candida]|uniref:helix-turn-helix domain-containing protein n=1 Tax=Nonomuraea candida TaxID=359159 RepID=UPI0005B8C00F|nr:helix-turn-helix domain-containing protein [Nonomuraea candida]
MARTNGQGPRRAGHSPKSTSRPADRYERFLELDRPGVSAAAIAEQLDVTERTVVRWRRRARRAALAEETPDATPRRVTDRRRERIAQRTLQAALNLAMLVRDEDADACQAFVQSLPRDQQDALPYVLAALVPMDRPVSALLDWITWDENGRPLPGAAPVPPGTPTCVAKRVPATPATAKWHRDQGRPLCDPCREAESAYRRDLYQAKKRRTRAA